MNYFRKRVQTSKAWRLSSTTGPTCAQTYLCLPVNVIELTSWKLHSKKALYFLIFDLIVKAKAIFPTLNTVRLSEERNVFDLEAHPRLLGEQLKVLLSVGWL
ncbi:hypothetical protein K443DRAFT_16209 [Laccaria amethystina LaAM-08-1]|uniref:Uncharacterized protein n=1 Tax=Laccaria amethystina LaAM-08-1 TaxID=1095629 RepID=A0A0C9WPD1_9AGAR|nr:hypothetical protein K443DRAFT_16209 [Laccaria amethystina LaAM-08-1]